LSKTGYGIDESEKVPTALKSRYDAIVELTDHVCQEYLTNEYQEFSRRIAAKLCRKRPSPLATGKPNTWACGIVYALGKVNFLFDKSQEPYIQAAELCSHFGISQGTGAAKSKAIITMLNSGPMDPHWTFPSKIGNNPMAWMIQVNGLIVDARYVSREVQEEAFRRGMIPYLP